MKFLNKKNDIVKNLIILLLTIVFIHGWFTTGDMMYGIINVFGVALVMLIIALVINLFGF